MEFQVVHQILSLALATDQKWWKIQTIFDIENWLWKSEIGTFQPLDLKRWSTKRPLRWKSATYHSIKQPFDVEFAENFLNGI